MKKVLIAVLLAVMFGAGIYGRTTPAAAVTPGGVFVTGHDPDYHAYRGGNTAGSQHLIQRAIAYVTFGKASSPRVLLVTDLRYPGDDNSDSRLGMTVAGYTFDLADYGSGTPGVLDLHTVNFSDYDVVVVASDYGGWLRQEELDILNARAGDLLAYVNAGGGVAALNESGNRSGSPIGTSHDRYGFLPFIVSDVGLNQSEVGNHDSQPRHSGQVHLHGRHLHGGSPVGGLERTAQRHHGLQLIPRHHPAGQLPLGHLHRVHARRVRDRPDCRPGQS